MIGGFTSAEATPGAGGGPTPFAIGLVGDWGYTPDQRSRLPALIADSRRQQLAFLAGDGCR